MKSLVAFFSLTFGVTWALFLLAVGLTRIDIGGEASPAIGLLVFAGTIAPAVVALTMAARYGGGASVKALIERIFLWRVNGRWYVFALLFMAGIKFVVAVAYRMIYGVWPEIATVSPAGMVLAVLLSTPFQAGEEVGWRGYALPRLAERMGLRGGSVVLGCYGPRGTCRCSF